MAQQPNKNNAAEAAVAAHYGLLLGIQSPWQVQRADLDLGGRQVQIVVAHSPDEPVTMHILLIAHYEDSRRRQGQAPIRLHCWRANS